MTIKTLLFFALPLIFYACAPVAKNQGERAKQKRPNVILIMADDLGYETLTCNGGESYQTPNLDKLATTGARFTKAYATPLCTPSRVQIMTGKYNFRNYQRFGHLDANEKTFANYFKEAGYKTAIAGKWQLAGNEQSPINFGFDNYCLWQLYKGDFWYRFKNPRIIQDRVKLSEEAMSGKYGPDVFTNYILDFIKENKDDPFFVYYPMVLVHDPFQPTPDLSDYADYQLEGLNDTTYFHNMMAHMDMQVGKIYDQVKALDLLENTIIVFTGDNGTDRDVISTFEGRRIRGDKGFTTEAGTHVPLIVHAQGKIDTGSEYDNLVDFTDILPSLLNMAEIEPMADFDGDGVSFWGNLTGVKTAPPRNAIFCSYSPRWAKFTEHIYVQDTAFKLYADGRFYHYLNDLSEDIPLSISTLASEQQKHYKLLKAALDNYLPEAQQFLDRP